ncbi:methionine--tRNA ligase [Patescibacteria group bacterium]
MKKNNYYITTTLPYVNAEPHIGFGLEIVAADVIARYQKLLGKNVVFNTGTDEHGLKIYQKALEENKDPKDYVDEYAVKFDELKNLLNLSYTNFIRTTDEHHIKAAQEFWNRCKKNGDIDKKLYKVKYCVGCELEKTDSELVDGKCHLHPNRNLEIHEEENYFFKFSKYQDKLMELYQQGDFVKPSKKQREISSFVGGGLQDFSISRRKEKMPWGVPVPGDDEHVMYVWFDALVNYISTLGWPNDEENFDSFWPVVQIAGKDNLRQQSAMWQAMLLSAGLPTSKQILINGFISVDDQKMSKSLGNVISPKQLVKKYGVDGARFLLIDLGPVSDDMDVSWSKFDERYNAFLANGLGNLVSRVARLAEKNNLDVSRLKLNRQNVILEEMRLYVENYEFNKALDYVFGVISGIDKYIEKNAPWKKSPEEANKILENIVIGSESTTSLIEIAKAIEPIIPESSRKIVDLFSGSKITKGESLFPRI